MSEEGFLSSVIQHLSRVSGPDAQGWWTALCPFHDDHHPSLRFNGKGFRCMACGAKGNLRKLAIELGVDLPIGNAEKTTIVATYDYQDENHDLLFQVVRYEPKNFKQRRSDGKGNWIWGLDGARRVLYRLPELQSALRDQWIFIVEGEKAVDALMEYGFTATCSPMGAGKWREEYNQYLVGCRVVIFPDNDDPGISHAYKVAASLVSAVATLKVLSLSCLGSGQDVYDWLQQGNTAKDLLALVQSAPEWKQQKKAQALDAMAAFIRRFVILSESQLIAIALWVMHTHAFDVADTTPYLNISSPEKRSGKTRLLEVLELLVARPWFTGRVTAAVLARKVDAMCPTLLLDESDAAFKGEREYAEMLRGILNSGYRKGGRVSVCVGQGANIGYKDFSTFCPKAIAGIGKLPDTIADRSIPITLKRRAPNETVARFRRREVEPEAEAIRNSIIGCLTGVSLADARPQLPDELNDRAADCWEPLLAIADAAGGEWHRKAKEAAIALMTGEDIHDDSLGIRLLIDINDVFSQNADPVSSADLIESLNAKDESPWGGFNGSGLTTRKLASLLKPYGIRPRNIRTDERVFKGYSSMDFEDAWSRYLPISGDLSATSATLASGQLQNNSDIYPLQTPSKASNVADDSRSYVSYDVADVADRTSKTRDSGNLGHHQKTPDYCPATPGDNTSPEDVNPDARRSWRLDI